jgi:hypothetical protein
MRTRLVLAALLLVGCSNASSGDDQAASPDAGGGPSADAPAGAPDGGASAVGDGAAAGRDASGGADGDATAASDGGAEKDAAPGPADAADDGADPGGGAPPGYTLAWEDLFDTGTVPDSSKWSMYDSPGNGGNGLRRPSAFSVHDGMVDVVAQMESGELVSGGMAALYSATYGYFAFRARSDADPSNATDAVVLTWPDDGIWPQHGENDIYETGTSTTRDPFNTFIHYGTTGSTQYAFTEQADGKQWHVMGMEWTSTAITIYRDGTMVGTVTDANAIPRWNHHPCIQLDAYKQTMGSPVHMYVDWVRVYQ